MAPSASSKSPRACAKNLPIEPDMVKLEGTIKETGLYAVKLNLGFDIETEVKVAIIKL